MGARNEKQTSYIARISHPIRVVLESARAQLETTLSEVNEEDWIREGLSSRYIDTRLMDGMLSVYFTDGGKHYLAEFFGGYDQLKNVRKKFDYFELYGFSNNSDSTSSEQPTHRKSEKKPHLGRRNGRRAPYLGSRG